MAPTNLDTSASSNSAPKTASFSFGGSTTTPPAPAAKPAMSFGSTTSPSATAPAPSIVPAPSTAPASSVAPSSNTSTSGEVKFWKGKQDALQEQFKVQLQADLTPGKPQDLTDTMFSYLLMNNKIKNEVDKVEEKANAIVVPPPAAVPTPAAPTLAAAAAPTPAAPTPTPAAATASIKPFASPPTVTSPAFTMPPADTASTTTTASSSSSDAPTPAADPDWNDVEIFQPVRFLRFDKSWKIFTPKHSKLRLQTHKTDPKQHRMVVRDDIVGKVLVNMLICKGMMFEFTKVGEYGLVSFKGINDASVGSEVFGIKTTVVLAQQVAEKLAELEKGTA